MAGRKSSIQHSRKTTKVSTKETEWTIGEVLEASEVYDFLEWFRRQPIQSVPTSEKESNLLANLFMQEKRRARDSRLKEKMEVLSDDLRKRP